MNTENPNGQKQTDSYQDDIFINTSEQQGKLFHFMGNTSLANQFSSNANKQNHSL